MLKKYFKFDLFDSVIFFTLTVVATISLLPLFQAEIWPMNHEGNSFFLRTVIYADHFKQGDFLPLWSVTDNNGLGSPQPILYHKLFYFLSGAFFAFSNNLKASILVSIWSFLMIGGVGMYFLCRLVGCSKIFSWGGASIFLVSNYTITNWLIRGAMGEFSAAMLVPMTFAAYISFLKERNSKVIAGILLGLAVGFSFLAHSVLTFYLVFFLGIVTIIYLVIGRIQLSQIFKSSIIGVIVFFLIAGPVVFLMYVFGAEYEVGRITPSIYLPQNQIKPFFQYFWDSGWQWGETWRSYTVQIDLPILILLIGGLFFQGSQFFLKSPSFYDKKCVLNVSSDVLVLVLIIFFSFALQASWSKWFYEIFPGGKYIQFPWRLLAIITPLSIALAFVSWGNNSFKKTITATVVIASFALSGFWVPLRYGEVTAEINNLDKLVFSFFGEYVPVAAPDDGYQLDMIYKSISNIGCELEKSSMDFFSGKALQEVLIDRYRIKCTSDVIVPLPFYASRFHRIEICCLNSVSVVENCQSHQKYPGLCALNVAAGDHDFKVFYPTVKVMLNDF